MVFLGSCLPKSRLPFRNIVIWVFLFLPAVKAGSPSSPHPANPATLKTLSLEQLSQIDVTTPSKAPVQAFKTPAAIYVITGEDIRRTGVTTIPDALRLAPGVEVAQIDGSQWSIGIRGFGTNLTRSVLVLIDGRTVYTPLFAGTYWDVQNVMMDDIDRIEVIRGPGGTIWGPNAVDGVIDIITKSAKDTQGTLVSAGGGNVEQGFANVRYGGGNGGSFNYRVYGMGFTRGPEQRHPAGQNFDDWRNVQGGFRIDWNKTARDSFTLQGDIYDQAAGESVLVETYAQPYSRVVDANVLSAGGNVLGRWQRTFSEGNDLQLQVYYSRTSRSEPILAEVRNTFDVDFLDRFRLGTRQEVSWGLGARIDPLRDSEVETGVAFTKANRTDYLLTGFVQDEIALVDRRLSLVLGTKLLKTNFTRGVNLEPSARLLWTPDDRQSAWAAFTHALRTPSDSEEEFNLLGYVQNLPNGLPYFARFNANQNFATEQLNGYELGYRRLFGQNLYVDVAGFYNHYHGLFSEDLIGSPFLETNPAPTHFLEPGEVGNGLLAYTKGVEIAPEWRPASWWRLLGSYSYLHMNVYKAPGSTDFGTAPGTQGSSPQHEATIQSQLDLPKKFQLDLIYRYVSSLPGQYPGTQKAQFVRAYSTGDARIGWRFNPNFDLSLVGRNLFQPAHFEYGSDPLALVGIKRSVYAKLTWNR